MPILDVVMTATAAGTSIVRPEPPGEYASYGAIPALVTAVSAVYGFAGVGTCAQLERERALADERREREAPETKRLIEEALAAAASNRCERALALDSVVLARDSELHDRLLSRSQKLELCRTACVRKRQQMFATALETKRAERTAALESCESPHERQWTLLKQATTRVLAGECEQALPAMLELHKLDGAFHDQQLMRIPEVAECRARWPELCRQRREALNARARAITSPAERLAILRQRPVCE